MDSLYQKNKPKIKNIVRFTNLLLPAFFSFLIQADKEGSPVNQREEGRRKKLRRGYNEFKLASHHHKRYSFCAINEHGAEDSRGAVLNIIIVHGLRGYGSLYKLFAEYLRKQNYNVVIVDLPGHGDNGGEKCRIFDLRYSDQCIRSSIVEISKLNPDAPVAFIAFSMGALAVFHSLLNSAPSHLKNRVIGVAGLGMPLNVGGANFGEALASIIPSALTKLMEFLGLSYKNPAKKDVPAWKIFCAPLIAFLFSSWKVEELSMDKDNISHDPEVAEEIWNDPMIYKGPLRAKTGYLILKMAENVYRCVKDEGYKHLGFSVFFGRGEFDEVAKNEHYAEIPIITYAGKKHELLKGFDTQMVRDDLDEWIKKVLLPSWTLNQKKKELEIETRSLNTSFFKKLTSKNKALHI
jgi:alpha-beta hydrolase superfamily lysophospholipase